MHGFDHSDDNINLENKIIIIEKADPGYDWIFGRNITGLITKFGGANSHMAIRSAEFGLPAVIGIGEQLYNEVSAACIVEIDCKKSNIEKSEVNMIIGLSQRVDLNKEYNETRDCLDQNWYKVIKSNNCNVLPIPNCKDPLKQFLVM